MTEIVSRFKDKPHYKSTWKALYFGLSTIFVFPFLGIFASIINPIISRVIGQTFGIGVGFSVAILSLTLSILALVFGIKALKKGERSWVLWIGFVPAVLVACFWIFMIVGEFLFPH